MSRDAKRAGGDETHYGELIDAIAASTGESESSTSGAIDAIVEVVTAAVTRGETVQLVGFRSFSTGARAERAGRNP
jgi:DNA-binding protein HU-beta